MKYMGSKARIANEILSIILKNRLPNQYYIEPFYDGLELNFDTWQPLPSPPKTK